MKIDYKKECLGVNYDYVLCLQKQENGKVIMIEFPMATSNSKDEVIERLCDMPYDYHNNCYDICRYFNHLICSDYEKEYHLCLPKRYSEAYVNEKPIQIPMEPSYFKYMEYYERIRKSYFNVYYKRYKTEDDWLKHFHEKEFKIKLNYASTALNYYMCYAYDRTVKKISKDSDILAYSREEIGWKNFEFQVNEDVKVLVKSNFGFGASTYLFLTITYKDVPIIPYSAIVSYSFARMGDVISYSYKYVPKRNSWKCLFEDVMYFVNNTIDNNLDFLKNFLQSEANNMMEGLNLIKSDCCQFLNSLNDPDNEKDAIRLRFVSTFTSDEKDFYASMPSEFETVFMICKLSSALSYIENLKFFSDLCPDFSLVIEKIKTMNLEVRHKIEPTLSSILNSIEELQKECDEKQKEAARIKERIDRFDKSLERKLRYVKKENKEKYATQFYLDRPIYNELKDQDSLLRQELFVLRNKINQRNNMKRKLEYSANKISQYIG